MKQGRVAVCGWGTALVRAGAFLLMSGVSVWGAARFPQPQFDSGHVVPVSSHPPFVSLFPEWVDVAMLLAALGISTVLVYRVRSRPWILTFSVVCLVFFGFVRQGCFCPIGSIQNVAVAAWQGGGLAWGVAAFFVLPLLFSLLFGRVFCASVCPLGVLQELFVIRPLRVPRILDGVLRLVPLAVLSIGLVCALNGAGYLICRTDPFVGLFRRSAPLPLLLVGMAVLLAGMVIARPYCRYFCPYGVLLEGCSRLGWKRIRITPADCINCRLCVGVCPIDAVVVPREALSDTARIRQSRWFVAMLCLAPFWIAGFAGAGWLAGSGIALSHPVVHVATRLQVASAEESEKDLGIEAFRKSGRTRRELMVAAADRVQCFRKGSALAGAFMGLVIAFRLLGLSRLHRSKEHEADRYRCVACGRCYPVCPKNGTDERPVYRDSPDALIR